jgi:hypothetical protein
MDASSGRERNAWIVSRGIGVRSSYTMRDALASEQRWVGLQNDSQPVSGRDAGERVENEDHAASLGQNRDNLTAQHVRDGAQNLAGLNRLAQSDRRLEETIDRRRVLDLEKAGIRPVVLDQKRAFLWPTNGLVDDLQVGEDVAASSDERLLRRRIEAASAEELGIDRGHVRVASDRERAAVEVGGGSPDDR